MKVKINLGILIFSLIIIYGFAFVGNILTSKNISSDWYIQNKPSITPPNFVFPIVWNVLFFLIALSFYLILNSVNKRKKKKVILIFVINLFFNTLWSYIFFNLQNPILSFFDLILILITTISMIYSMYKINKLSSIFLIPYLIWVGFAGVLNLLWIIQNYRIL